MSTNWCLFLISYDFSELWKTIQFHLIDLKASICLVLIVCLCWSVYQWQAEQWNTLSCWRGSLCLSSIPVIQKKSGWPYHRMNDTCLSYDAAVLTTVNIFRFINSKCGHVFYTRSSWWCVCVCEPSCQSEPGDGLNKGHLRYWPIKLTYLTFYGVSWQMALIISVTLFIITLNYRKTSTHTHTHAPS